MQRTPFSVWVPVPLLALLLGDRGNPFWESMDWHTGILNAIRAASYRVEGSDRWQWGRAPSSHPSVARGLVGSRELSVHCLVCSGPRSATGTSAAVTCGSWSRSNLPVVHSQERWRQNAERRISATASSGLFASHLGAASESLQGSMSSQAPRVRPAQPGPGPGCQPGHPDLQREPAALTVKTF